MTHAQDTGNKTGSGVDDGGDEENDVKPESANHCLK
jgi:hypothetical protein